MSEFLTTRWSLIARAHDPDERGHAALSELCQTYWPPLMAYALRRGLPVEDAKDATQGFFSDLLEKGWISRATIERGKFRTFLLTAMQRYVTDLARASSAQKRGGGQWTFSLDESRVAAEVQRQSSGQNGLSPEEAYDLRWAMTVLERALARLRDEAAQAGREAVFAAMSPFLSSEAEDGDYHVPAVNLGMSNNAFSQAVSRLRHRYRDAVRQEIADTVDDPERVPEEMQTLIAILRRSA